MSNKSSLLKLDNKVRLLVDNWIRNNYEEKYNEHTPVALKSVIKLYSKRCIKSQFLDIPQDIKFYNLLQNHLSKKVLKFRHIFTASQNQFSAARFHECCDTVKNTLVIIKSEFGNVFGGFTTKPWNKEIKTWTADSEAFLFLITCPDEKIDDADLPLLFKIKPDEVMYAICSMGDTGPVFGSGWDIYIADGHHTRIGKNQTELSQGWNYIGRNWSSLCTYENEKIANKDISLCGGEHSSMHYDCNYDLFQVVDYEVFQVSY